MNLTELARKLKVTTRELKEKLPEMGFHIGARAIQIPDEQAESVILKWQEIKLQEELQFKGAKLQQATEATGEATSGRQNLILLPPIITVHRLSEKLNLPVTKVISELLKQGVLATINDNLDYEIAAIIVEGLGFKSERTDNYEKNKVQLKEKLKSLVSNNEQKNLKIRPPVVVVMGHVDHGKTSLLDCIRQSNVASQEAGAITQHIGAYQVIFEDKELGKRQITFIDTPGHEAFNEMRSHGSQVADIAILVVAADDKVQPQTLESIRVIQEAGLPFVVAINKIDKPEADIDRIKKGLSEINLATEDWGGKTVFVPVSAKTGEGVKDLLKMVLLLADLEKDKLLVDPNRSGIGVVIESHMDRGEGPVATSLIYAGQVKTKDSVIIGQTYGRIRLLRDFRRQLINEAGPGMPVQILGLKSVPRVGDILEVVNNEKEFRSRSKNLGSIHRTTNINFTSKGKEEGEIVPTLNVVIRADVLGSLEAVISALEKLSRPEVKIKIIKRGLGAITDADFNLAKSSSAWLAGFNVEINSTAKGLTEETGFKIFISRIIYELVDEAKRQMNALLKPETIEHFLGRAEVLALFKKSGRQIIIGVKVKEGRLAKASKIRVWRKEKLIAEADLVQLQINKEEVEEARTGSECGLRVDGATNIEVADLLEVYQEEKKQRQIF